MTPKELKRLSRRDLLEMLLELSRENDQLRQENRQLQTRLEDQNIAVEKSGSLAEAALHLNGVFQAAQAACDQYEENIRNRNAQTQQHCRELEEQTRAECDAMIAQAQEEARNIIAQARQQLSREEDTCQWLARILNGSEE